MAPRRVFNNGRTVTVGGSASGGLNERFSQLEKSRKQNPPSEGRSGSVFARVRASNNNNSRRNDIQSRLSKPVKSGAIRKRGGPTPMKGVERTGPGSRRGGNKGNAATAAAAATRGGNKGGKNTKRGANNNKRGGRGAKRGGKRTRLSATDLDKSLDDYMMKDPKTAQSRLDAELNEYMDDSGDILMDL
ncbi:hypothetical protein K492DRAFT_232978 [Lichtheimia hyalospora FSU 10163]|nr:hypothetical protein K492DRAFT_232978 [Lichtheimia hyalospora FSU 10163]